MNSKFHHKTILCIPLLVTLTSCSYGDEEQSRHVDKSTMFKAAIGDKSFSVPIKCYDFDNDKFDTDFLFVSDSLYGTQDTNGDGIRVKGKRIKQDKKGEFFALDGISLDIVMNNVFYQTTQGLMPEMSHWIKTDIRIMGNDIVYMSDEGGFYTESYPISYEIICK